MKKIFLSAFMALALLATGGTAALAAEGAPPSNASCVAHCAVSKGGEHVAETARAMGQGVSACAQMS